MGDILSCKLFLGRHPIVLIHVYVTNDVMLLLVLLVQREVNNDATIIMYRPLGDQRLYQRYPSHHSRGSLMRIENRGALA